jgi:hypothetical protein
MLKEIRINKKQIKTNKKDNSVKTDYFVNCRGCKDIITADYRNNFDKRYCKDCS